MNQENNILSSHKLSYPAEELRTPINIGAQDIRNTHFSVMSIESLYNNIEAFSLNSLVPKDVVTQYDTARNLYLYAFHVYRFYNVAQQQVYAVLELAIRECIGETELERYIKTKRTKKWRPSKGLSIYMKYLSEHNLICNEDFPRWHQRNRMAAEDAQQDKVLQIMKEQNLEEYEWDETEIDETKFDVEWNYVEVVCKTIPQIRNGFAHGSTTLYNTVLLDFENVSIIINKMFERFDINTVQQKNAKHQSESTQEIKC